VIPAGSEVEVVGVEPGKFFVARPAERAPWGVRPVQARNAEQREFVFCKQVRCGDGQGFRRIFFRTLRETLGVK
jgi:hypothetical protein